MTPIAPVQPNEFQRVEPRYQLSMSESRDRWADVSGREYPTPEQRANSVVNGKKREGEKNQSPLQVSVMRRKKCVQTGAKLES